MRNEGNRVSGAVLARRLKDLRIARMRSENRKITREEVAKAAGVNYANLTNWELGRTVPGEVAVAPLADYYGVSPYDLLDPGKKLEFDSEDRPRFSPPRDVRSLVTGGRAGKSGEVSLIPGEVLRVPVVGEVPAGETAIVWEEDPAEMAALSPDLAEGGHTYRAVRVFGDSMQGVGIYAGARVIYDCDAEPRPGDIVVAELSGEFTIKSFFSSGDQIILQAANPEYAPIISSRSQVRIEGVVVQISFDPRKVPRRGK